MSLPSRAQSEQIPTATIVRADFHLAMTKLAQLNALQTLMAIADASEDMTPSDRTRTHAHGLVCDITSQIHDALIRGVNHE